MKHFRITNGRNSFTITHEEAKELMREIQSYLPMEVCESSDIKFLNERLRKAEAKIVSLENSNEQRKKELKHSWNLYEEIVKRTEKTNEQLVAENKKLNAHLIEHYGGSYVTQHRKE